MSISSIFVWIFGIFVLILKKEENLRTFKLLEIGWSITVQTDFTAQRSFYLFGLLLRFTMIETSIYIEVKWQARKNLILTEGSSTVSYSLCSVVIFIAIKLWMCVCAKVLWKKSMELIVTAWIDLLYHISRFICGHFRWRRSSFIILFHQ